LAPISTIAAAPAAAIAARAPPAGAGA